MKVAIILLAVAVVGAFAEDSAIPEFKCTSTNSFVCTFQELGHKIKYHAKALGNKLAPVGSAILNSLIDQGKNLLSNSAQAVAGTVAKHFTDTGVGKRDMAFLNKIKEHLSNGFDKMKKIKEGLHAAFKNAYTKLTGMIADNSMLKNLDENTDKKINAVVEEFKKSGKTGLGAMIKTVAGKIKEIFQAGMEKLREKFGKKVEARAVWGWDSWKAGWEKTKQALSDTFKPHIDTLTQGIKDLADKAKEHGNKLLGAAKDSFDQLKTKLSGHVDKLKEHAKTLGTHGTNALNAVKEALSSIATQAGGNIKDALNDIVKTGIDAAGVASNHVAGALGKAN